MPTGVDFSFLFQRPPTTLHFASQCDSSMSELDVWQVMEMLDRLYRLFDELTQKYNLFKVETIGDAYMTVANLRCPQQDHAALVARFAIEAVQAANSVMIRSDDSTSGFLSIRAGG